MKKAINSLLVIAILLIVVNCANQEEKPEDIKKENSEEVKVVKSKKGLPPVQINKPWFRPAAKGSNSAMFVEIINNTNRADTLYKAESELAKKVEVHETYQKSIDMMGMREVKNLVIPAKSSVKLKPGGYHVMLMKLNEDLKINGTGSVALYLKNEGRVVINAKVKEFKMPKKMNDKTKEEN